MSRPTNLNIVPHAILVMFLLMTLACSNAGVGDPHSGLSIASTPYMEPRDVSGLSVFQPQISGAMFNYEIPSTEELL